MEGHSDPKSKGFGLRPTLLSVVVLLLMVGVGAVGVLAYTSSEEIADHLWTGFADQIAEATTHRTLRYFEPAPPYVELTTAQAKDGRLHVGPFLAEDGSVVEPTQLLDHFRAAIEANPEFTWASFGGEDGTYVAVHRDPEGAIRGVWRTARGDGTTMRELSPQGEGWHLLETSEGDYDPRVRPWYQAAKEADRGVWVEPFVFATVRQPGFMYAQAYRVGEGVHGVFAVEYEMSDLSAFLSTIQVGENGRVYVVTRDGEVVGHPGGETTVERDGELLIAHANDHTDDMLRRAWAEIHDQEGHFEFEDLLAMSESFPDDTGIDWKVVVVAPKADFFGNVEALRTKTLAIAAGVGLFAVFFGVFFSHRVSSALRLIANELEAIGRFELEPGELEQQGTSFVREVNEMAATTLLMKRSLRSFGKYVPKEVVRELLLSGEEAELGGRNAELTVLFSDIAGFTSVTETMSPDALIEVLGEYLEGMSAAVRGEQGTVDKFIGDAVMAFWGAPREVDNQAEAACRGALAMQAKLAEMQAGWTQRGLPELHTRIGVNTGDVLVGNIGALERLNYTVMGDAVNLAARLEALNKEYGTAILIGDETAKRIGDAFVLRPIDFVAVKGKNEAVLVHELVGLRDALSSAVLEAADLYTSALEQYRERNFEAALKLFDDAAQAQPDDKAAKRMAERCRGYIAQPPADDWDGRFTMTTK